MVTETSATRSTLVCPACRETVETYDTVRSICCPKCDSRFGMLVGDDQGGWAPGRTIGRFELISLIGQGSNGAVWKAVDLGLQRTVALKIPRSELGPSKGELFLREGRNAAKIRHPNVVAVHDVCQDGNQLFLVQDLIEGESLADRVNRQPLSVTEAVQLVKTIALALEHVHEKGIVHRDLKLANILVNRDGVPLIADFGLSRSKEYDMTLTMDGTIVGTPAYMSPEQAQGESHDADQRSDIYSLGVILYELLTGELPFRGLPHAVFEQIVHRDPPHPSQFNPSLAKDLATITLKCLEKQPHKRFASAGELAEELGRFQSGEPIQSRPISCIAKAFRWSRCNPQATALIGLLSLLLVVTPVTTLWVRGLLTEIAVQKKATDKATDRLTKNREFLIDVTREIKSNRQPPGEAAASSKRVSLQTDYESLFLEGRNQQQIQPFSVPYRGGDRRLGTHPFARVAK